MKSNSWKQRLALFLCLALVVTLAPNVLANEIGVFEEKEPTEDTVKPIGPEEGALERESAIKKATSIIPLPEGYSFSSAHYYSANRWETFGSWRLEFTKRVGQDRQGSINYTIDAKHGELVSYNIWSSETEEPTFPPLVSRDEAKKIAEDFLDKIAPNKLQETQLETRNDHLPMLDSRSHHVFRYDRMHNGISFPQNNLHVGVSTEGKIQSYSRQWDNQIDFPSIESTITAEQAMVSFEEAGKDQFNLTYLPSRYLERDVYIAYQWHQNFRNSVRYIGGQTGHLLNRQFEKVESSVITYEPVSSKKLAPHFKDTHKELTEKEALEHALKLAEINLDQFKIESTSYSSSEQEKSNEWFFYFQSKQDSGMERSWVQVSVDTTTGQINNFYFEDPSIYLSKEDVKVNFTAEELLEKAKQAYIKFAPSIAHELFYAENDLNIQDPNQEKNPTVNFRFHYKMNGVLDESRHISVAVNKTTGEVVRFNAGHVTNKVYPEIEGLVSQEKALEKFFATYQLSLQYQLEESVDPYLREVGEETPNRIHLVYLLEPPVLNQEIFLNAKTGEFHLRESGDLIQVDRTAPSDIENHWAREALELMYNYRAIDTDEEGNIRPNELIKRGEMIKMLVLSLNQGQFQGLYGFEREATFSDVSHQSKYFQFVEAAADMNIIGSDSAATFEPEETLSREEMSVLIVKSLQLNKIASHHELFQLEVEDIEEISSLGHVAIVTYLGIITPQNGKFLAQQQVTRAEAATIFYRFLQKRNQVLESPRYGW